MIVNRGKTHASLQLSLGLGLQYITLSFLLTGKTRFRQDQYIFLFRVSFFVCFWMIFYFVSYPTHSPRTSRDSGTKFFFSVVFSHANSFSLCLSLTLVHSFTRLSSHTRSFSRNRSFSRARSFSLSVVLSFSRLAIRLNLSLSS